ncbi:27765_t:CDS:2 [Dentiscutata erythropus]|uniref:27765_t:CDS:1 n=1 Tax=Dentiscutata erythropus TaxID=1348616 RepID=A0A9N8W8Y3_9GLOM|nr:27765_t:CDS:2 [Dentiscutata erythropus]
MSNFKVIRTIETKFGISVIKCKSNRTGLSAVLVDVEAPMVSGFFAIPTEATDDDGCPHTLEHLVFLGSELYPYKGVLDTLANRAFAQGTNAWTETDHTCYTITTAGSEGFLRLLPIYVDHILYPTLTESGHYTEVHHINGNGEDAGLGKIYLFINYSIPNLRKTSKYSKLLWRTSDKIKYINYSNVTTGRVIYFILIWLQILPTSILSKSKL